METASLDVDIRLKKAVSDAQRDFYMDDVHEYPAYVTGFGGGKTYAGLFKAVRLSVINRGLPMLILAPDFPRLKRITWPTLFDQVLPAMGLGPDHYTFNRSDKELIFPWGSRFWFTSAEVPRKIVGSHVAAAYLDEAGLIQELAWTNTISRVRHQDAALRQTFATFTAESPGWTHERWGREELYGEPLGKKYVVYQGTTADNTFLPADYEESLKEEWGEQEAQSRVYGKFYAGTTGRAYYAFDKENQVGLDLRPGTPLIFAFDFNAVPGMHIEVIQHYAGADYVIDEVYERGLTLEASCEQLVKRYAVEHEGGEVRVYGDASGVRLASKRGYYHIVREILDEGFGSNNVFVDVPSHNPSVQDSVAAVNAALKNSKGRRFLFVHPRRCPRLKADLLQVVTKAERARQLNHGYSGGYELDKTDSRLTHASDALRYYIARTRPLRTPYQRAVAYQM